MSNSLSEDYLRWLGPQIREDSDRMQYWDLVSIMYEKPFLSFVAHDENRVADGMDLRAEYSYEFGVPRSDMLALGHVSFLEVLIGLSRRLSFAAGGSPQGWAWQLIVNLELHHMGDPLSKRKLHKVDDVLETVIQRRYLPDGVGGFFPLAFPEEDQTRIELWYQMAAFLKELHPEH